ncbi:hypothetical protein ASPVEDRAFT_778725 [Aspergillus versicolor CBS 583.65]|uniref:Zn(2)-C6 fungal-type domain-containing protein n=1 Tax=Aspergillus versicolor CBS 583.65 TaxID=1036611 RepID=A0A1L9PS07_ASPVE|nr:uncharacterized protein ASPVEDRAFT_778725 [Aspergillus versicolor CBS 583.65]OJJ04271.1 hypothetical protein ASPVEDRAFT_778725 [Aspergillus versicolor CBS 583.65]
MPARWRTKSGCLTCRMRRKKCDEESPKCHSCCRNGLTCIWSPQETPVDRHRNALSTLNDHTPSLKYPPPFGGPSRESLFQYLAMTMIPQLLIPGTPLDTGNELIPLAAQYPCLRDSFLACATLFLSQSNGVQTLPHALTYYSDAVRYTRRMIEESKVKGTEDWLLLQALLLCIFERAQSGPYCEAMSHLLGASRIMALKVRSATDQSTPTSPFQQMCAASLLYHAATTAFLSPDISRLPEGTIWNQLQQFIEPSYTSLFAIPPTLCRLILEISRLARRTPLNDHDKQLASSLHDQLRPYLPLQLTPDEAICSEENHDHKAEEIKKAAQLYALSADILLLKTTNPQLAAKDSRVQAQVKQIMKVLQSDVQGIFWNQHYSWPFAILGCVVQRETEMLFLLGRLGTLWERSRWGDIQRTTNLFRAMLDFRRQNAQFAGSLRDEKSGASDCPEPFDMLLRTDWLLQFTG